MWRRRRRKRGKIFAGCLILLIIGFVYGYLTNDPEMSEHIKKRNMKNISLGGINVKPQNNTQNQNKENQQKPQEDHQEENTEDREPIVENVNVVTDDIQIVFSTYYKNTRDMVTKESKLPNQLIGRKFDELQTYLKENYVEWNIRQCNKNRVELYQETDRIPPNYYLAKEYNGYIAIFKVNEDGENILVEQTEIPTSSLGEMDLQYIKKGIIKKKRDEINQILEDYSS
ncbi:BofC C-terminal domain-containing protein [Marinisporobacter balticus]|uniref:BofC-like protein n=1 Tax=Marinisporobacter balticus TaxID=2018667 RepID=A0A4R2L778_9FIRM|nr:BofC C-terminal domain-containing protein [Marinisporobacter balticus]TCO79856.1 BofC-like protein [Marinisporobacter balticus]